MTRTSLERYGFPILAGVLPLALYAFTACRDIFWMDSTEFMLVGRHLAISHPPGYPLLTLIIRLFSIVPILALPFRLSLVAAMAAAGSCLFAYFIILELSRDRLAGLFSALLWGVSFELWQQATVLEVYSFQVLLLSVLLLAMVKWRNMEVRNIKRQSAGTTGARWLLLAFFVFGLALTNHTPIVLWIPSLLILLLTSPARPGPRVLGFGVLLIGLAICLYIYVPLRSPVVNGQFWTGVDSLSDLFQFISGRMYRYRLLAGGTAYLGRQASILPSLAGKQLLAAWALVIPGAVLLWRSYRSLLAALLLGAAIVTVAALAYNIPDKEGYLLPAYLALLIMVGCGFAFLRNTRARRAIAPLGLVLVALPVALFLPVQNRSRLHGLSDLSRAVLSSLPPNSTVFTDDYSLYQGIRWQQQIVGYRADVVSVVQYYLAVPWYLDQLSRTMPVPEPAADIVRRLWQNSGRVDDIDFGQQAKAASQQAILLLVRNRLLQSRVFWIPDDFSGWPQDWNGLHLTMRGLCYEVAAQDTLPDLDSPLPPASRYHITMYRDLETQDICRRFAVTACRRGIIRLANNANTEAIRDFDLSLQYFPDYPSAIEDKGIVFLYSNQPDSARFYLNRFITLEPQSPELPKIREILARLGN
ncbi:MAG: DUF2723 domain-containing protein [candidate division WOR-3 bacterium]|nr:DUF2723 domain-containing protein [candidate division WOR-3 bacterium]